MKNLLNYLDDYFDENIEETLCQRKFKGKINISKDQATEWQRKANRKASRKEEIEAHGKPISYNPSLKRGRVKGDRYGKEL